MQIQKVKISKIRNNSENPRIIKDHKFHKLVKSLKEFPEMLQLRPIIVDENMMILGGNMRHKACVEIGMKDVYIIKASDLTPEQQKEFIVKDNVAFGEWDWDVLGNEWESELLNEWGMDVWEAAEDSVEPYEPTPDFNDEGVGYKSQYGVITECKDEAEQERVFKDLTGQGLKCKIVVT
jgi:ParB-like chromosome segregation protein Spo0J